LSPHAWRRFTLQLWVGGKAKPQLANVGSSRPDWAAHTSTKHTETRTRPKSVVSTVQQPMSCSLELLCSDTASGSTLPLSRAWTMISVIILHAQSVRRAIALTTGEAAAARQGVCVWTKTHDHPLVLLSQALRRTLSELLAVPCAAQEQRVLGGGQQNTTNAAELNSSASTAASTLPKRDTQHSQKVQCRAGAQLCAEPAPTVLDCMTSVDTCAWTMTSVIVLCTITTVIVLLTITPSLDSHIGLKLDLKILR
jgi:hypothetical protein